MRAWIERHRGEVKALAAGLVLRALFAWKHPPFTGDTVIYGDLAQNVLLHHTYGLTEDVLRPTLIRMPGYPLFLALCFAMFGVGRYVPVLWLQLVVGLGTCWLAGDLARRLFGERAGCAALWLACLCPFTANYDGIALTESWSLFCVALAFWALHRSEEQRPGRMALLAGVACGWAVLLRPEQGLLAAAVVPVLAWRSWRRRSCAEPNRPGAGSWMMAPAVAALAVALPLSVWALRNWRTLHVLQPLAPKYANDAGEFVSHGFYRWYRTWGIEYTSTTDTYWPYDGGTLDVRLLPCWAFDSPAQRAETAEVIAEYNEQSAASPQVDALWARLAAERIRAHPVRSFVVMPVVREADMWLRPRTEFMGRPIDWWRWRRHPGWSAFSWAYAALDWAYLGLAVLGLWRWRGWWRTAAGLAMVLFIALRCALLLTIDNSEPRYTLECFPVVFVLAAVAWTRGADLHQQPKG